MLSHEKFNAFLQAKFQGPSGQQAGQRRTPKPVKSKKEAAYVGKESNALTFDLDKAKVQLNEMRSEISSNGMRALIYIFNKNMRSAIQGLHVDMTGLKAVKSHIQAGYKVIFMPIYKSFMDFFILTYVN